MRTRTLVVVVAIVILVGIALPAILASCGGGSSNGGPAKQTHPSSKK
jgi:hypothetical protein